ncbi:CbtA family protein [Roseovarius aestuariivivens]|uniref:CbtA family protein n=1 Tax=Roseovarius aestuariivivens TaxID=1888910 RepID=UPI0010818C70|nr:CbtA family protein [Roseovarius aestuariivivens]
MFQKIATSALLAGFCAGLIAAALQLLFVQPVLLHAELYESGQLVHFGDDAVGGTPVWPGLDLVRDGLSLLFSALIYVGYALLLVTAMAIGHEKGVEVDPGRGVLWGIAGFVALHFAPAFSLPPEVPGVAAADITARQIWWWSTVIATAAGIALAVFGRGWPMVVIGAILILAPHLWGAPHTDGFAGPVPPELAALFASRALGVGLAAWALMGLFAGYAWQKDLSSG